MHKLITDEMWEEFVPLMGTMTDGALSLICGHSITSVGNKRRELGIPAFQPHRADGAYNPGREKREMYKEMRTLQATWGRTKELREHICAG